MVSYTDLYKNLANNGVINDSAQSPFSGWLMYQARNGKLLLTKYCDNLAARLGVGANDPDKGRLTGFNIVDLLPWYARERFLEQLKDIKAGQAPKIIEHPYVSFDGTVTNIEERVILFSDDDPEAPVYASVYEDIEHKKQAMLQNHLQQMISVCRCICDEVAVMNLENNTYINVTNPSQILPNDKQTGLISDEVRRFEKIWSPQENTVWHTFYNKAKTGDYEPFVPGEPICLRFYNYSADDAVYYKIRLILVERKNFIFLARKLDEGEQAVLQAGINNKQWDIAKQIPIHGSAQKTQPRLVFIRTFGYFDVFVNDKPIAFHSSKAKELLALLTDRRGGYVSSRNAISLLWEDEPVDQTVLARFRKVAMRLRQTLEENGIADIIEVEGNRRRINPMAVTCDLFSYLADGKENAGLFGGSYMSNYSWGENTLAFLEQLRMSE